MPTPAPRKVVIINFKGGVGKTTTAVNVSHGLTLEGFRVLLVDNDPQGSATFILSRSSRSTLIDLFGGHATLGEAIVTVRPNLDFIPSSKTLDNVNTWMIEGKASNRARIMSRVLAPATGYDFILIDTAPSFSLLNANAITFAEEAWIPVAMEYLALANLRELIHVLDRAESSTHKKIPITSVIPFMVDFRNKKTRQILGILQDIFPDVVTNPIRTNVKISEANFYSKTIFEYDPLSHGAEDFRDLTRRIIQGNTTTQNFLSPGSLT